VFSRFLALVASLAATAALAWPLALPTPELTIHDFRNGPDAVAASSVNVIGFGPAGEVYLAGPFNSVDGQPRAHGVARLSADNTLDSWNPALPFSTPPRLARQSASGVVALVFPALPSDTLVHVPLAGPAAAIRTVSSPLWFQALAFDDAGALYAAEGALSAFIGITGAPADIYKFSPSGTMDGAFHVHLQGDYNNCKLFQGPTPMVNAMVALDGYLYLGGNFLAVSGPATSGLVGGAARVALATGDVDPSWHPMPTEVTFFSASSPGEPTAKLTCFLRTQGVVNTIVPAPGQQLYLGGSFKAQGRGNLGRFSRLAPGAIDASWAPQASAIWQATLDPSAQFLYVGGGFTEAGGWNRNYLAAFSTVDGSVSPTWDPGPSSGVTYMAAIGDRLLVAGSFISIAPMPRMHLAGLPFASAPTTGYAIITLTPRRLDLGIVPIGTTATGSFTIGNAGDFQLYTVITGPPPPPPSAPGTYPSLVQTNDCPAALPPGATCTVTVVVEPGQYSGQFPVTIVSNGSGTTQVVYVAYTLGIASVAWSDTNYFPFAAFPGTPPGSTTTLVRTLTNQGNIALPITGFGIAPAGEFTQSNDCPASLAVGASCHVTLQFSPQSLGNRAATLTASFGSQVYGQAQSGNYGLFTQQALSLMGTGAGPDEDSDGDGIINSLETTLGLNPTVKDNDVFASAQLFAMQQYRDFLGREADAGGVAYWTQQVAGGMPRASVIESFFSSPEFQGTVAPVARLYFAYFLRIPDYGGLTYWIGQFRGGMSLETISNYFALSGEFSQRYGALNNAQFVDRVYQNVLGRAPDAGGRAFWANELDSGARTRGQVMLAFSESAEYRGLIGSEVYVTMAYIGMMRRAPDAGGFTYWVNYLDGGSSGLALLNGFLASAEYRNRFLP
jgi:hypothetical protein